ncbi:hypothetical protein Pmi06nite_65640 [Planotetraspora mira]|uniref:Uncharacterized protein n=1 Tax=Planotetraspora mira TaxID=58121 RepID=A0A8J3TVT0_9ACTN|nr:hypothetical protein Pmi06nite_65640 [Planotetraspora mira]
MCAQVVDRDPRGGSDRGVRPGLVLGRSERAGEDRDGVPASVGVPDDTDLAAECGRRPGL